MLPPSAAASAAAGAAPSPPAAPVASARAAASTPNDAGADRRRRLQQGLYALVVVVLAGWLIAAATVGLSLAAGEGWKEALRSTSLLQVHRLRQQGGMDSWGPMWSGFARRHERLAPGPGGPGAAAPYELALRLDRCKFQYPPSSWLLLEALPEPPGLPLSCVDGGVPGRDIHAAAWSAKPWLALASALACLGLVGLSMGLLWRMAGLGATAGANDPLPWGRRAAWWTAAALAGLGFYPLVKGHVLGQVQVFLNLALGGALLLLPTRPRASGVLVGLCCLVKPQYVLLLAWGLLRRRWGFAAALGAVFVFGHGAALARYGLDVHLQYLQLLQGLAQVGESFWANQSLNGLLNRLLHPGEAAAWSPASFPAYHPLVRWGTFAGSAGLLLLALGPPRPPWLRPPRPAAAPSDAGARRATLTRLDFAAMLAALTMASPIAWEHHYGAFLPLFALALGALVAQPQWPRRSALALGVAFVAMANAVLRPQWIFVGPLAGLAGSHLWFGALGLFGLLLVWRARVAGAPAGSAGVRP